MPPGGVGRRDDEAGLPRAAEGRRLQRHGERVEALVLAGVGLVANTSNVKISSRPVREE
jgi:hypothetical protein